MTKRAGTRQACWMCRREITGRRFTVYASPHGKEQQEQQVGVCAECHSLLDEDDA